MRARSAVLALLSTLATLACSGGNESGSSPSQPSAGQSAGGTTGGQGGGTSLLCTPGSTQACIGPGACDGGQACLPDGSGYGECNCGTEGMGGKAGDGGTGPSEGGSAGGGGSAGSGGPAGTGGGQAGGGSVGGKSGAGGVVGGAGGLGGTGGTSGTGGAAGLAGGQAGTAGVGGVAGGNGGSSGAVAGGGQAGTGGGGAVGGTGGASGDPCDEECALKAKACSKASIPGCKESCVAEWFPKDQSSDCAAASASYLSCLNSQDPNWTCNAGLPEFVGPQGPDSICYDSFYLWINCIPPAPPTAVNVLVQTVYFAPYKAQGFAWDSNETIPKYILDGVVSAMTQQPILGKAAAEALDWLQKIAIAKFAKPDPIIYADILNNGVTENGGWIVPPDGNEDDNYVPQFSGAGINNLPFVPAYSIRLKIDDEDLVNNDSAGAPIITFKDISNALKLEGKTYFIKTNEESFGQVLFVGIAVFPAN